MSSLLVQHIGPIDDVCVVVGVKFEKVGIRGEGWRGRSRWGMGGGIKDIM